MGNLIRCIATTTSGESLEMQFRVEKKDPEDRKLKKLYTDLSDLNTPRLLNEEEIAAATTHEAIILTLSNLEEFIRKHDQAIPEKMDSVCHIHRDPNQDPEGTPYLCWSQLTPDIKGMKQVIHIWTMLNVARVLEGGKLDFNEITDFKALAEKHGINIEIQTEE